MNGTVVSGPDHKLFPYSFIWGRKQIVTATRRFLFGIQEDIQWAMRTNENKRNNYFILYFYTSLWVSIIISLLQISFIFGNMYLRVGHIFKARTW